LTSFIKINISTYLAGQDNQQRHAVAHQTEPLQRRLVQDEDSHEHKIELHTLKQHPKETTEEKVMRDECYSRAGKPGFELLGTDARQEHGQRG